MRCFVSTESDYVCLCKSRVEQESEVHTLAPLEDNLSHPALALFHAGVKDREQNLRMQGDSTRNALTHYNKETSAVPDNTSMYHLWALAESFLEPYQTYLHHPTDTLSSTFYSQGQRQAARQTPCRMLVISWNAREKPAYLPFAIVQVSIINVVPYILQFALC